MYVLDLPLFHLVISNPYPVHSHAFFLDIFHMVSLVPTTFQIHCVRTIMQPLFDALDGTSPSPIHLTYDNASDIIISKILPLNDSQSIYQHIPRCFLTVESFNRIASRAWLKDDLLSIFTNILNLTNNDSSNNYLCFNTP